MKKSRRGFTLVELVVVIGIIVILTGIAVPAIWNYVKTSQLMQYNDYAKTIYLNAQSYLTKMKSAGRLEEVAALTDSAGHLVDESMVEADYYGGKGTSYLMLSKDGEDDPALRDVLDEYIYDTFILDQSICVEWNVKTGMVYSVCYSETADGFFYSKDAQRRGGSVSISNRSEEARKELRFGYYSADPVNPPTTKGQLENSAVEFVNGEQLLLRWTDALPAGSTFGAEIHYTVKLWTDGESQPLFSLEINANDVHYRTREDAAPGLYQVECRMTTYEADGSTPVVTGSHWLYRDREDRFVLVLDSIDTSRNTGGVPNFSILERYSVPERCKLSASVSAEASYFAPNMETFTNPSKPEDPLFASASSGQEITLSKMRHLYNARYADADSHFHQTADLSWKETLSNGMIFCQGAAVQEDGYRGVLGGDGSVRAEGSAVSYAFQALSYQNAVGDDIPFTGTFDGENHTIEGLYLTGRISGGSTHGYAGLFAENAGTIQSLSLTGLTLRGGEADGSGRAAAGAVAAVNRKDGRITACKIEADELSGTQNVGGVAGINAGEIGGSGDVDGSGWQITVRAEKISGADNVGGVAGSNTGSVSGCSTGHPEGKTGGFQVSGGSNVGGVVGVNEAGDGASGSVGRCETTGGSVTGAGDYIGGIIGKNLVVGTFGPYQNSASVTGERYVGGIVGLNEAATIENCKNTGLIWAKKEYGGGITGANGTAGRPGGNIQSCSSVVGKDGEDREALLQTLLGRGEYGDYIGGVTGYNNGTIRGTPEDVMEVSGVVVGNNYVGGVVGHNDTRGTVAYYKAVGGVVVAQGDFAGGYFGLNTSRNEAEGTSQTNVGLDLIANPRLVKGRCYVGGAIGANLVSMGGSGTLTITCKNSMGGEGEGQTGEIRAEAFAGGVVGYNGVIPAGQELRAALEELREAADHPFDRPYTDGGTTGSFITRIQESQNHLGITANIYVGGIIGLNSESSRLEVVNSVNYGALSVKTEANLGRTDGERSFYIGGITGRNSRSGVIDGCTNAGAVESLSIYTGGIAEVNDGTITDCSNRGTVNSDKSHVGGIVGLNGENNQDAKVINCKALDRSAVRGTSCLGSLVGENRAVIDACVSEGRVTGVSTAEVTADYVGGIVGLNSESGVMKNVSTSGGAVSGWNYVGGIAGKIELGESTFDQATMEGLTNMASVTGNNYVGGIVGQLGENDSIVTIKNCTNKGKVGATGTDGGDSDQRIEVGGITGANRAGCTISYCENSGEVTGKGAFTGGIVSYNNGQLLDCYAAGGTVTGANSAGGLTGLNEEHGSIEYMETEKPKSGKVDKNGYVLFSSNVASGGGAEANGVYYLGGVLAKNESKNGTVFQKLRIESGVTITYSSPAGSSSAKAQYAGGILAYNRGGAVYDVVEDCQFAGTIRGGNLGTGGIVGVNDGTVRNITVGAESEKKACVVASNGISGGLIGVCTPLSREEQLANGPQLEVSGVKWIGGFYGKYDKGAQSLSFVDQTNYAKVTGPNNCGGLFGEISCKDYRFVNCENRGTVTGGQGTGSTAVGGLLGYVADIQGSFTGCRNRGTVNGANSSNIGGLLGSTRLKGSHTLTVTNCENASEGVLSGSGPNLGGLIGRLSGSMTMTGCSNLGTVNTQGTCTGGLLGLSTFEKNGSGAVTIENCVNGNTVKASGGDFVGGIMGKSTAEAAVTKAEVILRNCTNESSVQKTKADNIGGILGGNKHESGYTLLIENCRNKGKVVSTGGKRVGGIAGILDGVGATLRACESDAAALVSANADLAGGIAGYSTNSAKVAACKNYGTVKNTAGWTGGVLGQAYSGGGEMVRDCQNYGRIEGGKSGYNVGGIVGGTRESAIVEQCVNLGTIASADRSIGGIVGFVEGNSTVRQCENGAKGGESTILIAYGSATGGIVGTLNSVGMVKDCKNYSDFWDGVGAAEAGTAAQVNTGSRLGGIVGNITDQGQVESCENYGDLRQKVIEVGGIVGAIEGKENRRSVTGCKNYGRTEANGDLGGIVGYANKVFTIEECINYGEITLMTTSGRGGGIFGSSGYRWDSAAKKSPSYIRGCVNFGGLNAPTLTAAGSALGGIAGYSRFSYEADRLIVTQCANFGEMNLYTSGHAGQQGYGGIFGMMENYVTVEYCANFGSIALAEDAPGGNRIGGIVGFTYQQSEVIRRCINAGDIDAPKATEVGGIVGRNISVVSSCLNMAIDPNQPESFPEELQGVLRLAAANKPEGVAALPWNPGAQIAGKENVGGIAGILESDTTTKTGVIYSEKSAKQTARPFDQTRNLMDVTSQNGAVGGLVGKMSGGSVSGAYNLGAVQTLKQTGNNSVRVGGAVGSGEKSGADSQPDGTIAGVFYLGSQPASELTYHGGILGYRSADVHQTLGLKDSFYFENGVPSTTLPVGEGKTAQGRWRVGNEPSVPDGTGVNLDVGAKDAPLDESGKRVQSLLNEEDFAPAYQRITGTPLAALDWSDKDAVQRAVETFLWKYAYTLDAPEILDVDLKAENSNAYTVTWTGGQGALRGYQLEYQIYSDPEGQELVDTLASDVIGVDKARSSAMAFDPKYIGCYFKVGVKSLGIGEDTVNGVPAISNDSEVRYQERLYLILPPLPEPGLTEANAEKVGETTYTFTIPEEVVKRYLEAGRPVKDYTNLAQAVAKGEPYKTAYSDYINQLKQFTMTVRQQGKNDILEIVPFERNGDVFTAKYTFDLGSDTARSFNLTFAATPKGSKIEDYFYYVSSTKLTLTVKRSQKLDPPSNVRWEYTGDLNNPSYVFRFDGVAHASGYRFLLADKEGNHLLETTVASGGAGTKTVKLWDPWESMSEEQKQQAEEWLGRECVITVQSLGDGDSYITSDETSVAGFTVIDRLEPPDVSVKRGGQKDVYVAQWKGGAAGDSYEVSVTQREAGSTGEPKLLFPTDGSGKTTDTSYTIDYTYRPNGPDDALIENDFTIGITARRLGKQGVSLTSNEQVMDPPYTVYSRLPQVTDQQVKQPTQVEKNSLRYRFDWSGYAGEVSAENCVGYGVYRLMDDTTVTSYELVWETDRYQNTTAEILFDEADAGKTVNLCVVAYGKEGVRSDSIPGALMTIVISSRAEMPKELKVEYPPVTGPVTAAEFANLEYRASWKAAGTGTAYAGYSVEWLADGVRIDGADAAMNTAHAFHLTADHAGKELTVRVQTRSLTAVDSEWAEYRLTLPKVKLETPTNLQCAGDVSSGYTVSWDTVLYADSYKVTVQTEEADAPSETNTTEGRYAVPPGHAVLSVSVQACGDGGHYVDSEAAVLDLGSASNALLSKSPEGETAPEPPGAASGGSPGPEPGAVPPEPELTPAPKGMALRLRTQEKALRAQGRTLRLKRI